MRPARHNPMSASRRRGVTLLEMLVTVALLLLMMTIIVAIFASATGAVTTSRAFTMLDQDLRRLDVLLRQDLGGVTCRMTPPNNPQDNKGYFEYAENALSDGQDEDSDDTLRFTCKAPDEHPFTGRVWVRQSVPGALNPVTTVPYPITSTTAEVIYFLRGDKLYRRVRLILPKLNGNSVGNEPTDVDPVDGAGLRTYKRTGYKTNLFEPIQLFPAAFTVNGAPFVSWQGLNDVSARPAKIDPNNRLANTPVPNSLGDLTDRHKRFASPRFEDDYQRNDISNPGMFPDGLTDDFNGDGVPDYYPTMYPRSKIVTFAGARLLNDTFNDNGTFTANNVTVLGRIQSPDLYAFPYLFPNAFSQPVPAQATAGVGRLHSLDPTLATFNHNPLATGDSLTPPALPNGGQTWWGFPTWRETMAATWLDPVRRINEPAASPYFTGDPAAQAIGETAYQQFRGLSPSNSIALPRQPDQPFSDGLPATSAFDLANAPVFEDDLIAVNVRSFNVKAFDPNPRFFSSTANAVQTLTPGYFDLGYLAGINPATGQFDPSFASGQNTTASVTGTAAWMLDTMGHEGRMPPLVADGRVDPQVRTFTSPTFGAGTPANLGDDNAGVVRMRRIWDSWSTTYSNAPAYPIDPSQPGPRNGGRAVVPSYPAPYPVPLRGIEIQIRLNDPDGRYVKTLTIRQDFTDKL